MYFFEELRIDVDFAVAKPAVLLSFTGSSPLCIRSVPRRCDSRPRALAVEGPNDESAEETGRERAACDYEKSYSLLFHYTSILKCSVSAGSLRRS